MNFIKFMLPYVFLCSGIMLSSYNAILGLIISSIGLPTWIILKHLESKNSITVGEKS